jgi:hypothetical protein
MILVSALEPREHEHARRPAAHAHAQRATAQVPIGGAVFFPLGALRSIERVADLRAADAPAAGKDGTALGNPGP